LLDKILENPILSILTALTALLAALNGFIGSIGLPPFWADLLVSVTIAGTTVRWAVFIWSESRKKETITGVERNTRQKISFRALWNKIGPTAVAIPLLGALLVWNGIPLLSHIGHANWTLCGAFMRPCNHRPCLILIDSRGRRISEECFTTDDDSGYKYLTAEHWWTYQPDKVVMQCDANKAEAIKVTQPFLDGKCEGSIDIQ
jgi:hypothetical protein